MPSMKRTVQVFSVLPLLFLVGCGDGWEVRPYDNTPYGERTAGHGVQYVRAHMMPKKGPVLEPEMKKKDVVVEETVVVEPPVVVPPETVEEPVIEKADEMFNEIQKK